MAEEQRRGHSLEITPTERLPGGLERSLPESLAAGVAPSDEEILLIDGEVVPYLRTPEGVRIYYQPPAANLIEAARNFVDTQREESE